MKTGFSFSAAAAAIFVLAAFSACGERELTIGEYAEEVKERVVEKIKEALSGEGRVAEVSGTVTFAAGGVFFLQRDDDGLKVFAKGRLPNAGDVVTVEGSPSLEGGRVVFVASKWKRTGSQPLPAPRQVSSDEIIHVDGAKKGVNWLRVEIEGRVIGATIQGFKATILNTAPVIWPLGRDGYAFNKAGQRPMRQLVRKGDLPVVTMKDLRG